MTMMQDFANNQMPNGNGVTTWRTMLIALGLNEAQAEAVGQLVQAGHTQSAKAVLESAGMSPTESQTIIGTVAAVIQARGPDAGVSGMIPQEQGFTDPVLRMLLPNALQNTNLPPSEFRSIADAGMRGLLETRNLNNLSPFARNQMINASQDAAPLFGLAAALGRYGQPGIENDQIQLGGQGVQGLARNFALQNIGGPLTTGSFRSFFDAARQGLGEDSITDPETAGQSAAIMAALGINASDSATSAYGGVLDNFVQPRVNLLPNGIRNIFNAAFGADAQAYLGGRSSAEITPSEFLGRLQNRGILF
jgi:hypothetical protein